MSALLYGMVYLSQQRQAAGVPLRIAIKDEYDCEANKYSKTLGKEKQLEAILKQLKEKEGKQLTMDDVLNEKST